MTSHPPSADSLTPSALRERLDADPRRGPRYALSGDLPRPLAAVLGTWALDRLLEHGAEGFEAVHLRVTLRALHETGAGWPDGADERMVEAVVEGREPAAAVLCDLTTPRSPAVYEALLALDDPPSWVAPTLAAHPGASDATLERLVGEGGEDAVRTLVAREDLGRRPALRATLRERGELDPTAWQRVIEAAEDPEERGRSFHAFATEHPREALEVIERKQLTGLATLPNATFAPLLRADDSEVRQRTLVALGQRDAPGHGVTTRGRAQSG